MPSEKTTKARSAKQPRESKSAPRLVLSTASRLRELVMAHEEDEFIGAREALAEQLGVGVVTLQQAARILQHEGLLHVRRGPGGGYYSKRPDDAALERSLGAYVSVHGGVLHDEILEVVTLFEVELSTQAAQRATDEQIALLKGLFVRADGCDTAEQRVEFEHEFHRLMFVIIERPLMALLSRVTNQLRDKHPRMPLFEGESGVRAWKDGRKRLIRAVYERDVEAARFEGERYRREMLERLRHAPVIEPGGDQRKP